MIPVCEPVLGGKEIKYVQECLKTNWISSMGKYISMFESRFAQYCGCKYAISTTSGTSALHLALASAGIGKGDEVIIPAFTMIATAFAVIYTGEKPVLVDACKDTWCMDVEQLKKKITKKTKAILPVHIYGHPCEMNPMLKLAKKHNIFVIEDAAESHGAEYRGKKVGSLGDIACFSFYGNKIITTGEGGMIVTNNKKVVEKARSLKDLAFSRKKRFLHCELGFNYRMTNIQAAIGLAQLEQINKFVQARRRNAKIYNRYLRKIDGIVCPVEKEWVKNVYWMYGVLVDREFGMSRDNLMKLLRKNGIDTRTFFIPMHKQPVFKKMRLFLKEIYPVAEELSQKGMYLPSSSKLKTRELGYIANTIGRIRDKNG